MSTTQQITTELHLAAWLERLQDAVDGALEASMLAEVQAHLCDCVICKQKYQQLCAIDLQLQAQFAQVPPLTTGFDNEVFARIAVLEREQRLRATQCEQQEYQARRDRIRTHMRELLRFNLGNVIGVAATCAAIASNLTGSMIGDLPLVGRAMHNILPTWAGEWRGSVMVVAMAAVAVGAISVLLTRRFDPSSH